MAQACSIYLFALVYIYYQNGTDARALFKHLDPSLGKQISDMEHTYDDDCTVNFENIIGNMDHYFLIHFINWFLASVILRDAPILHMWSILDEILELSFQWLLPHFRECWWDHVFHDVIVMNTSGIFLGLKFVQWMGWE